jgi:lipopolysaccharide/colanic/teichoic acid biosynthesis glycosyltransferase
VQRVAAAFLLLLTVPLWAAIAVAIWLSDGRPVFYLGDRVGLRGVRFRVWKFRTMRRVSGSRISGPQDARIFPFGTLLRKLRLDELPQLINILRGEMAFVGPRPEDPWFVENAYTDADRQTLEVLPGLTSPGTIYYVRHAEQFLSNTETEASYLSGPMQEKLALDREYVAGASAWRDFRLVGETAWVLACLALERPARPQAPSS